MLVVTVISEIQQFRFRYNCHKCANSDSTNLREQ